MEACGILWGMLTLFVVILQLCLGFIGLLTHQLWLFITSYGIQLLVHVVCVMSVIFIEGVLITYPSLCVTPLFASVRPLKGLTLRPGHRNSSMFIFSILGLILFGLGSCALDILQIFGAGYCMGSLTSEVDVSGKIFFSIVMVSQIAKILSRIAQVI